MNCDVSTTASRLAHHSAFRLVCKALSGRHGHPRPSRNLQPHYEGGVGGGEGNLIRGARWRIRGGPIASDPNCSASPPSNIGFSSMQMQTRTDQMNKTNKVQHYCRIHQVAKWNSKNKPAIAQLVENLTVDVCSDEMAWLDSGWPDMFAVCTHRSIRIGKCEIANLQTDNLPPVRFPIVFEGSELFSSEISKL